MAIIVSLFVCYFCPESVSAHTATLTTSNSVSLDVLASHDGVAIDEESVNVTTTCRAGYNLSIATSTSSNLYLNGDGTGTAVFTAVDGTSTLANSDNKWGYSLTANASSSTVFSPLSTTATVLKTTSQTASQTDIDDTFSIYYGTKAADSVTPGSYQMANNGAIVYYLTMDTSCDTYTIAYDDNNATAGTMGAQTQDDSGNNLISNSSVTLLASNYNHTGYGFAGWSLVELNPDSANFSTSLATAVSNGKVFGPQETITLNSTVASEADSSGIITMYALWVKAETGVTLQTWDGCGSMSIGDVKALSDARDTNTYAIAKLADGNCWMIENMRIASTNSDNGTGALAQGYGGQFAGLADPEAASLFTSTATANSLYSTDGSTNKTISGNSQGYRFPRYNNVNTPTTATDRPTNPTSNSATNSTTNAGMYSYGNYYTWAAAIANTSYYSTNNQSITSTSICPTGWHLPKGGNKSNEAKNEFWPLVVTGINNGTNPANYDSSTTPYYTGTAEAGPLANALRAYPNNFVNSGYTYSGSVSGRGSNGAYWSSTTYSSSNAYGLDFNNSNVRPGTYYYYKYYGRSIRCLATINYTVSFDANGGTGTMSNQSIPVGTAANLTSNSFTRSDYYFAGWNTAPNGSGTSYTDGQSVTDLALPFQTIVLYAQWVECPGGYICYGKGASSGVEGTMGEQSVGSSDTSIMLLASNYSRQGYGFAGWNTKADGTGTNYGPQETITFTAGQYSTTGLKLYAKWVASAGNLQNWSRCSSLAKGAVTALTDRRDNETYAIAKLADGNCWMIENMRLENTGTNNTSGSFAQGYNSSFAGLANPEGLSLFDAVTTANSLYSIDGSTSKTISGSFQANRFPRYNNVNTPIAVANRPSNPTANDSTNSTTNAGMYSYGNYYTWAAAIADTSYYSTNNQSITSTSICPTGWHLPKGGDKSNEANNESFTFLKALIGAKPANYNSESYPYYESIPEGSDASNALRAYPNNFVYSGGVTSGSVKNRGSYGGYWSSTVYSRGSVYDLSLKSDNTVRAMNFGVTTAGRSIRCLVSGS